MKPIVNQEEYSCEAHSERNKEKKGKENEDRFLEELIVQEEEEEDTQGDEADNNKANDDDSKSVWYHFGSLIITIDPSNGIMADLFVDHYFTVTWINTVCQ